MASFLRRFVLVSLFVCSWNAAGAQSPPVSSCDALLLSPRRVKGGKTVGPSSCAMQESSVSLHGAPYTRLDVGLDGTVEGTLAKTGPYREYLTNVPELVFPQSGNPGPFFFAIARYERAKGAAMTIVFPEEVRGWNGKMYITVHGRGSSFKEGQLKAWDRYLDPKDPVGDLNKYDRLMVAKGYALVKTYRTSSENLGEIQATLEDGTVVDYAAFNDTARYVMDFGELAKAMVEKRLGRRPARTYLYGHSAGGRIGRGFNYSPGLNVGRDGKPFIDGLLADDAAAGTWLPVVYEGGVDVLFRTPAEAAAFVPQIDVSHQMYNAIWPHPKPDYLSSSYLENKRRNARLLRDKGIAPRRQRMYEVRDISHMGQESPSDDTSGSVTGLDLSKMMDRFVDLLDAWVDKGTEPPPTRSDWAELGDANRDGRVEHPALAFPETACPLGVYFPWPKSGGYETSFAAFTGEGLEPLDKAQVPVDMNRNGVWDFRETPTAAWRRLGLIGPDEGLTRETYVACVKASAEGLAQAGFFSATTAAAYVAEAQQASLGR